MKKIKGYILPIIMAMVMLIQSSPVYAEGVGLADKPYSLIGPIDSSANINTLSANLEDMELSQRWIVNGKEYDFEAFTEEEANQLHAEYREFQESNEFENIYLNGAYIMFVRDRLGNGSFHIVEIEGLSEKFEVDFIDIADDDTILNTERKFYRVGELVAGSLLGADTTISKYYPGHVYTSCSSTTVSPFEKNIVYRKFTIQKYNVKFHSYNGENISSEIVRYGHGIASTTEPTRESESTTSETVNYIFSGWADKDGNIVDTSCITRDMDLYPVFKAERVQNIITIGFHYNDEMNTIIYRTGVKGEIEAPEPNKEDTLTEKGRTWYSFLNWEMEDETPVRDINVLTRDTELYARYEEIYVPNYEPPTLAKNNRENETANGIIVNNQVKEAEDLGIVFISNNEYPAAGIKFKDIIEKNKTAITSVATTGILLAIITAILQALLGMGIIQAIIFLHAFFVKNKRYVAGAWLLGQSGIKYVDKYGREVKVTKTEKGYTFATKKGKKLHAVDARVELKKLDACRINQKELERNLRESEVYTVFSKDVRIAYGNAKESNKAIGFNFTKSLEKATGNVSAATIRFISNGKEIIYNLSSYDGMTI